MHISKYESRKLRLGIVLSTDRIHFSYLQVRIQCGRFQYPLSVQLMRVQNIKENTCIEGTRFIL